MKKAILYPTLKSSVKVSLKNNTNWSQLDMVQIPDIMGTWEVRSVENVGSLTIYNLMPA